MCYAIPAKIIELSQESAVADYGGVKKRINISLVKPSMGDYVLVHAGFAIQILDKEGAKDAIRLIKEAAKTA